MVNKYEFQSRSDQKSLNSLAIIIGMLDYGFTFYYMFLSCPLTKIDKFTAFATKWSEFISIFPFNSFAKSRTVNHFGNDYFFVARLR